MAKEVVATSGVAVKLACAALGISEACYRYQPKRATENEGIADHSFDNPVSVKWREDHPTTQTSRTIS
jgi:hypothetical protein